MMYLLSLILAFIPFTDAGSCPNGDSDCDQCWSHNDPHIMTLDGVAYDQHTDGCFKYVTTCSGATNDLPFELCGCHYDCGSHSNEPCPSNIRCIGDITLTLFDSFGTSYEVSVDADNPTDDAYDTPSASSLTSGVTYTFDTVSGHTFLYTKTTGVYSTTHQFDIVSGSAPTFYAHVSYTPGNLNVWLNQGFFSGNTCGLCGFYNGVTPDDFLGTDGTTLHVDPSSVTYPTPTAVNSDINAFADDYKCDISDPTPVDPSCAPLDLTCINDALDCCRTLWDEIFSGLTWDNDVINQDDFMENWLNGCAQDACALTINNVDCENRGDEFVFAKNIAIQTATAVYTIQTTAPPTTTTTAEPEFASNCTAKICAHGDNRIWLDVSYDSGNNWDLSVASEMNWKKTMTAVINPVDANTVLRFTVKDVGHVGGFIATVQLCGTNGYVFGFYTDEINTYFDVISDSAGDPLLDVFDEFGTGAWANFVNEDKVSCMNEEADWMWNDKIGNTMVFELYFGHHLDILKRLDCVEEDTPAPTVDCCSVFSLVDYLDTCYCGEDTTAPPTKPPLHVATLNSVRADVSSYALQRDVGAAESIGLHRMDGEDGVKTVDGGFYHKMNEEMNEIKNMVYTTWVLIFLCAVIHMAVASDWWKMKRNTFKVVEDKSEDEV